MIQSDTAQGSAKAKGQEAPQDSFSRSANAAAKPGSAPGTAFAREAPGAQNLFQLARTDPAAARQLVRGLATQVGAALNEIEQARVGAQSVLEKLAAKRFNKEALEAKRDELRREREKLSGMKLRAQMASRKMALLQQVAGKIGDPRLDEEIDKLLQQHKRLKTSWGRRYDALSLGKSIFGDYDDTPEHLRTVVKTEVRAGGRSGDVSEALENLSPRQAVSELIARSIDGSTRIVSPNRLSDAAKRGELGRSTQNFSFLSNALSDDFEEDPFDKP